MDRQVASKKKKSAKKGSLAWLGWLFTLAAGTGALVYLGPQISGMWKQGMKRPSFHDAEEAYRAPASGSIVNRVLAPWMKALASAQQKAEILQKADLDNKRLRLENANLRVLVEGMQFQCDSRDASRRTEEGRAKLGKTTGTRVGRLPANVDYRIPTHLLPSQLYTLAVTYLKAREDEKAAVIFDFLLNLEDNDAFRTSKNFVLSGVAWYRLDNLKRADEYFTQALSAPTGPESLQYQAQARLWRGIVAERLEKHLKSQFWLRELVDHHPHSMEAQWVNSSNKEVRRVPATEDDGAE